MPVTYLDKAGVWRHFPDGWILSLLDKIGTGAALFTVILGPYVTGVAAVPMLFLFLSRDAPPVED
jgi:hypothetical protein